MTKEEMVFVKETVCKTLGKNLINTYVIGSRARKTEKKGSDLDLLLDLAQPMALLERAKLDDCFEESDLPYRVDLVDGTRLSSDVRARMLMGAVLF
jgi:predicted nucleotidyltransferase